MLKLILSIDRISSLENAFRTLNLVRGHERSHTENGQRRFVIDNALVQMRDKSTWRLVLHAYGVTPMTIVHIQEIYAEIPGAVVTSIVMEPGSSIVVRGYSADQPGPVSERFFPTELYSFLSSEFDAPEDSDDVAMLSANQVRAASMQDFFDIVGVAAGSDTLQ